MKLILNNAHHAGSRSAELTVSSCLSFSASNQSMEDGEQCNNEQEGSSGMLNGRPLKKAKYAWQVKRGRSQSMMNCDTVEDNEGLPNVSQTTEVTSHNMDDRLRAVAIHDGNVSRPPPLLIDESSVEQRPNFKPKGNTQVYPTYVLHTWQSKQLAQGVIDNVINNVLGDIGGMESLSRNNRYNVAIDAAYDQVDPLTWGQYLNAQNIENEGVAEAIRQQGLQRGRHVELQSCGTNGSTTACQSSDCSPLPGISNVLNCAIMVQEKTINSEAVIESAGQLESDDLLAKAVSCAISRKGLGMLVMMPQQ